MIVLLIAVDTLIGIREVKGVRTIASEQRYGRNIEETVHVFDAGTKSLTIGSSTYEITQAEKELELHSIRSAVQGRWVRRRDAVA